MFGRCDRPFEFAIAATCLEAGCSALLRSVLGPIVSYECQSHLEVDAEMFRYNTPGVKVTVSLLFGRDGLLFANFGERY